MAKKNYAVESLKKPGKHAGVECMDAAPRRRPVAIAVVILLSLLVLIALVVFAVRGCVGGVLALSTNDGVVESSGVESSAVVEPVSVIGTWSIDADSIPAEFDSHGNRLVETIVGGGSLSMTDDGVVRMTGADGAVSEGVYSAADDGTWRLIMHTVDSGEFVGEARGWFDGDVFVLHSVDNAGFDMRMVRVDG